MNKENLYGWVFTYNPYRKVWLAAKRDNYHDLFSNTSQTLRSSKIETLVELIMKTDGDEKKIKQLLKN